MSDSPEGWINDVHLGAEPIKSLDLQQQQVHDHIFCSKSITLPEFDKDSERFSGLIFYDDLEKMAYSVKELNKEKTTESKSLFFSLRF